MEEKTCNKKELTFVKTPEVLKSKRAILNPHNNDNKSFQYSIAFSLCHEKKIPNIKSYVNNFNWENINFPPTQQDYQNFEMNNTSIALNILTINNEKQINYFYESQFNNNREINNNISLY